MTVREDQNKLLTTKTDEFEVTSILERQGFFRRINKQAVKAGDIELLLNHTPRCTRRLDNQNRTPTFRF
jgi:hypothetical protein